jgi:hypothetical protein
LVASGTTGQEPEEVIVVAHGGNYTKSDVSGQSAHRHLLRRFDFVRTVISSRRMTGFGRTTEWKSEKPPNENRKNCRMALAPFALFVI